MLGVRYFKSKPTAWVQVVQGGRVRREGTGLAFHYFGPTTALVSVPVSSRVDDFFFNLTTADFQAVTVQGAVTWRIADPKRTAGLVDFTLRGDGVNYASEDPEKLPARVLAPAEIFVQRAVQARPLRDVLLAGPEIAAEVEAALAAHAPLAALGVELLGIAVTAVRPTPDAARALEAETRESILKAADDAVFARRNAAVENERAIRESELDTEVAVEQKKRQIKETQMDAEASLRRKKAELKQADMESEVVLEERRRAFVDLNAANTRTLAEAEAHKVAAVMDALEKADPRIVQSLAASGMAPGQLIAQAFGGIAERAERIGQLNMSPDLLEALMTAGAGKKG